MKTMSTVQDDGHRKFAASAGACGVLLLGLLSSAPAGAAWEIVPELGISAETEDNPGLQPDALVTNNSAATNTVLGAGATFANLNERSSLTFSPQVISYIYSDTNDADLESTDWYLDGQGQYQWRTVAAGFDASLSRERILSSELAAVDPDNNPDTDNPDEGDSGRLLFINDDRERFRVAPYVSFRVSERNSLRLEAVKYGYKYTEGDRSFRTGFDSDRLSLGIERNTDTRNRVSAVMSFETYEADGTGNTTDTVTIEGAFRRPLSQLWSLNLTAGVLRSDFEYVAGNRLTESAATDYTMRVSLRKRAERSRTNIDFVRGAYPSASGYTAVRREIRMYYDRALTQRVNARFGVRLNETKSLGDVNVENDREYARAEVEFEWAWKPVLFLQAGYRYTTQDFTQDLIPNAADSNSFHIGMAYRGLSRRQR
jgi:hypothetical protein